MKDLGIRLISGIIGLLILGFVVYMGGHYLNISVFIITLVGLFEFYRALRLVDVKPFDILGYLGSFLLLLAIYIPSLTIDFICSLITIVALTMSVIISNKSIKDIAATLCGFFYIPFLLFHLAYLDGTKFLWLAFFVAFSTDTFAYVVGNLFGKHKLVPQISPKKSVEGAIGGVIGCIITSIIYGLIFDIKPLLSLIVLAIIASIMSQIGDLVASRIKRLSGIKDFGTIMPGHGGALDRFDSIIFAAPIVFYFAKYFLS